MTQLNRTRFRIHFTKYGDLRWISHRDLARVWERLLRRTGIELAFSQGFHPKPKISFPTALALGTETLDEVVELEVLIQFQLEAPTSAYSPEAIGELGKRISAEMPVGMELLSIRQTDTKAKLLGNTFRIAVPEGLRESTRQKIDSVLAAHFLRLVRDNKSIECSVNDPYFDLRLEAGQLIFTLPAGNQEAAVRPIELLQQLGLDSLIEEGAILQKIKTHLKDTESSEKSSEGSELCQLSE